jgi:hypothetical protein
MSSVNDYNSYSGAVQRLKDSYEAERKESSAAHDEQVSQLKAQHERALKTQREDYQKELSTEKTRARSDVQKLKEDLYGQDGKKVARELQERQDERRELDRYRKDLAAESQSKISRSAEDYEHRLENAYEQSDRRTEEALAAQRRSHSEEMKPLNEELQVYRNEGRDVEKEKARARQETISEYEKAHLTEKQRISDSYEHQFGRMREREDQQKSLMERKVSEQSLKSDSRSKELIRVQRDAYANREQDLRDDQRRMEQNYKERIMDLQARNEKGERDLIRQNQEQTDEALSAKDQAYQDYLEQKNLRVGHELNEKDAKIRDLQTTQDPFKVSAGVVNRIHKIEEKRYLAQMNQERDSHARSLEAARSRDASDRDEMRARFEKEAAEMNRSVRKESDLQKRGLIEAFQDLKDGSERQIAQANGRSQDRAEKLHNQHALDLVSEQRRSQDALAEQREQLHIEKDRAMDDLADGNRTKNREWEFKIHDTRREFESKLNQEREDHEKQLALVRYENDKKLRDSERNSKRLLEEKIRSYEHQLKQREAAFHERERFLTEHYDEELDRMKTTNAHLISKKS